MNDINALNLRPRSIVELIDQAFRLYRSNFVKFVGIVAIALVPVQIIQLLLNLITFQTTSSPSYFAFSAWGVSLFIMLVTTIFVNGVANGALTSAISSGYLGEPVTIGSAYSKIRGSWGSLIWALLLLGLFSILILIWTIVPCAGWFTGVGALMFISLVVSPLVAPVIVIEHLSGSQAIRRAWDLSRRRFWWLVGYFLLIFIINLLVIQVPVQILATVIQRVITGGIASTQQVSTLFLQLAANSIVTLLLSLIYYPLQSTCATLVYFDLRIRQEGFDLAMMANQTSETPLAAADLAGRSSGAVSGSLIAWKEVGNFALMSLAILGIYVALFLVLMGGSLLAGGY